MKKITLLSMLFVLTICFNSYSQFGCATGIVISDGYTVSGITTPGSGGAEDWNSPNPTSSCSANGSYWDDDVYMFTYTAGASDEQISMSTLSRNNWNGLAIFTTCSGTALDDCLDASTSSSTSNYAHTVTATISAGQTVYIATGQWGTPNGLDFDVTAFSATPIVTPPNCDASLTTTTDVALSGDISWSGATGSPSGYKLMAGSTTGGNDVLALTDIGNVTTYNLGALTGNTTYYVTITPYNANGDATGCSEQTFVTAAPAPTNDLCANATPYTDDFTMFAEGACTGSPNVLDLSTATDDAGVDSPSCDATGNYGVWYTWTATTTGLTFTMGTGNPGLVVYEAGTCGALIEVGCLNNLDGTISGLTVNNDYLIHIYDDTAGNSVNFCLEEYTVPPPPANDDCANAIVITASPNNSCANAVSGTTTSATNSANYSPSCGSTYNEVWYSFTPATSEIFNITRTINTGSVSTYLSIWTGSCGTLTRVNSSCFSTSLAESLTSGTTYLISVATANIGAVDFDLCIYPNPPAPGNDECSTATALTVNADLNCGSFVSGTVASATQSADAEGCTGTYDDDVWYSFVAVGTEHVIQVNNIAGSTSDLVFQLSEGTCGSLTELGCYDTPNSGFTATGLTPGNSYYVRVATWSSSTQDTTFDICVGTTVAIVPDYTNDFSSYPGAGWSEADGAYGTPVNSSSLWTNDDFGNDVGHVNGQSARIEIWGTTRDEYLISPEFDLSASDYYLNFDIALTIWNTTASATLGVDDYVALLVTQDGTNWSELTRWDSGSTISSTGEAVTEITLSGYGANVKFAFYAFSDTSNEDNNFYVDNFDISATSSLSVEDNVIKGFKMYPNPVNDVLSFRALDDIESINIYNLLGQEVMRAQPQQLQTQMDISKLPTGMYVVKVKVGEQLGSYRVVKQ